MPRYYMEQYADLPEPPVAVTKMEQRLPKKGDWCYEHGCWIVASFDYINNVCYCFTPKPQSPKKIIGFKKGTKFYRNTALKPWAARTPNGKKWEFGMTTDDYATEILRNLDSSITEFTTLEDGTSL